MTKSEVISYIKNLLPKVDKTLKYHDNVVAFAIDLAMEHVFNELYKEDEKQLDQYAKRYMGVERTSDFPFSNKTYSLFTDIGASPINIPQKSKGIIRIEGANAYGIRFIPTSWREYAQMDVTELGYYSTVAWYIVETDRIIWLNSAPLAGSPTVNIHMIPRFYDLQLTDDVNFPYGQSMRVVEYVMNNLRAIPPKDLLTNNADRNG